MKIYSNLTDSRRNQFLDQSLKDFKGDNALHPLPRMITEYEFQTLRKGTEQRGTALRKFLQDHYSGNKTYLDKVIPKNVIDRILKRTGDHHFDGKIPPEQIAFPYGPDIIRNPQGQWVVLEDNVGYIGGIGDLDFAKKTLLKNIPEYSGKLGEIYDSLEYYKEVVRIAKERAYPKNGAIVLIQVPPYPDNEDYRIRALFKQEGVKVITPNTKDQILINSDGVWIKDPISKQGKQRVGYLFLNGEHLWLDGKSEVLKQILDEFNLSSPTRRGGVAPGLIDAIIERKVAVNYAPGVDFVGDKEFYMYVDDLVRFYMKEDPILKNLPTLKLEDPKTQELLFSNGQFKNYVIKAVDGRGGDDIFIGPKMNDTQILKAKKRIMKNPSRFIAQPFNHLSVVEDHIVDIRMISDVNPKSVYVSTTPWSRGTPISGNGKVNISSEGKEFVVIVTKHGCEQTLLPTQ
jgi:uncharacterized circularly permuted ATP-grasp superfamily protein